MMDPAESQRLLWIRTCIAAVGVVVSLLAFVLGGAAFGVAAATGAVVATGNWIALTWILRRVLLAPAEKRPALLLWMLLKMAVLGAVCYLLVAGLGLDAFGFLLGLTSFVVGLLFGALSFASQPTSA